MEKEVSDPADPHVGPPDRGAGGKRAGEAPGADRAGEQGQPEGPSDRELVERVQQGRREAFDALIRRYQRQAVAVSYRLLGNSHDALEVTQDAFLKAYTSLATLQKPEAFGGWLMRIVSNLSLNYRRSRRTRSQLPLDDLLGPGDAAATETAGGSSDWMAQSGDPVHKLESQEMGKRLQEALNQLPEKQRLAIIMFTIEEMPQKQVAESLGCSVEAVKWHVFQGRKKLKELLKEHL
jgi:RNA polymerase sigma-70 factor, ECF subfamily